MSVIIYGASDDLIEVEGDVTEEFYAGPDDAANYLALSNGVVLSVVYDNDGYWRIRPVALNEDVKVVVFQARGDDEPRDDDDCPGYSDKAVIDDDIRWVLHASGDDALARRRKAKA